MATVLFGFTMFFSLFVPAVFIAQVLTGFLSPYPPVVFVTITFLINILVPLAFSVILIRHANIMQRVPTMIPGAAFLWVGGILYLVPQVLRILGSMAPGGSETFVLLNYATPMFWLSRFLMCVGIVRLLLAIRPHPDYEYAVDGPAL